MRELCSWTWKLKGVYEILWCVYLGINQLIFFYWFIGMILVSGSMDAELDKRGQTKEWLKELLTIPSMQIVVFIMIILVGYYTTK